MKAFKIVAALVYLFVIAPGLLWCMFAGVIWLDRTMRGPFPREVFFIRATEEERWVVIDGPVSIEDTGLSIVRVAGLSENVDSWMVNVLANPGVTEGDTVAIVGVYERDIVEPSYLPAYIAVKVEDSK